MQGFAQDQYYLAEMYFDGQGVDRDLTEAFKWFHKAAEQGNTEAQHYLGVMYRDGHGPGQDYLEAIKWYRKAAEQGHAQAKNDLGQMYRKGQGVARNTREAIRWIQSAAEQGLGEAQYNLGWMYRDGLDVTSDYAEALHWYRKAAERGESKAQFLVGWIYENGEGVPREIGESRRWFREAEEGLRKNAEQGDAEAQFHLGLLLRENWGTSSDATESGKWFREAQVGLRIAAEEGDSKAQLTLGEMYFDGLGVPRDYGEASKWFGLAAERGLAAAQYRLGLMYHQGHGVDQDDEEAVEWYSMASGRGYAKAQGNLQEIHERVRQVAAGNAVGEEEERKPVREQGTSSVRESGWRFNYRMIFLLFMFGLLITFFAARHARKTAPTADIAFIAARYAGKTAPTAEAPTHTMAPSQVPAVTEIGSPYTPTESAFTASSLSNEGKTQTSMYIPFEFNGKSGEYFKIWVVNVALTILTLGIYSAWAKVRRKRYFYGNTFLQDAPFDYLADPVKILKGRVFLLGMLAALTITVYFWRNLAFFLVIPAIVLFPWLVVKALTFNARNSSYRNIRFEFRGNYRKAAGVFIALPLLIVLSFGLFYPRMKYQQRKFFINSSGYGTTPFAFWGPVGIFYRIYFWRALGLSIVVGILTTPLLAMGQSLLPASAFQIYSPIISFLAWITMLSFLRASVWNQVWSYTELGGAIDFDSSLSVFEMVWIHLSNAVAIILSLGLLIPWASIRKARYLLANLRLHASGDLDNFVASEQEKVGVMGEEIVDFLDFDFGL